MNKGSGRAKKWILIAVAIVIVLVVAFTIYWETHHGNRQLFDLQYRFNYAMLRLPDGSVVEGKVSSWLDYDDSDVIQVTINGKTYLTHYSNVVLIDE